MAVPESMTTSNLSGTYDMNKNGSDPTGDLLKMQGVGWVVRQAAAHSNISITLKQYTDETGKMRLDVDQTSTGGMKTSEERVLDWEWSEKDDKIWGKVRGRARLSKLSEVECDPYLREGWLGDEVVENDVESISDTWIVKQLWGFAEVDGQRKHVRRVYAKKGKVEHRVRMVYDYKS